MTQTVIAWGDPKAVKVWSPQLSVSIITKSYFNKKFVGKDNNSIIHQMTELEKNKGDRISFDLSVELRGKPVRGDARAKGTEENLRFYTDEVIIDQIRHPVSQGGRMTNKRVLHNLRSVAKERLSDYWARYLDELMFMYLSGARGINPDFVEDTSFTGHANNAFQAPDTQHLRFGGAATSKASITSSDVMDRDLIERAATYSKMMRATDPESANMVPTTVEGSEHYVTVMSPIQEHDMRTTAGTLGWADIQKAAAGAEGKNNPIFKGGLGMISNVVLHCHERVIRFSDYGSGSNLPAARALFMGRQAGVIAYGTAQGSNMRYDWQEETDDYGNEMTVNAGCMVGMKATVFNGRRFGCMALDTYAAMPA